MFEGLLQPMHWVIILFVAILVFGPNKLPRLGADLGKSIRDFKKAMADGSADAPARAPAPAALPAAERPSATIVAAPAGAEAVTERKDS